MHGEALDESLPMHAVRQTVSFRHSCSPKGLEAFSVYTDPEKKTVATNRAARTCGGQDRPAPTDQGRR